MNAHSAERDDFFSQPTGRPVSEVTSHRVVAPLFLSPYFVRTRFTFARRSTAGFKYATRATLPSRKTRPHVCNGGRCPLLIRELGERVLKLKRSETNRYKRGLPTKEAQLVMQKISSILRIQTTAGKEGYIGYISQAEKIHKFKYKQKSIDNLKTFHVDLSNILLQIIFNLN